MNQSIQSDFASKWVNLAQPRLGCKTVYATDDFFAAKERMIQNSDPVFIDGKYDDNGKWMDGWESRRKRGNGHDYCVLKFGQRAIIKGFDIDTRHFTGNYAPAAMIEGCISDNDIPDNDTQWQPLTEVMPLSGNQHHYVEAHNIDQSLTHIRLNIYPDGGVARLRVYGQFDKDWDNVDTNTSIDLIALENGGRPIIASDEHFGILSNILAPGRGENMGDGWETRRRREPGSDWAIIELGHIGRVEEILIDTAHFKGNFPDRCSIQAINLPNSHDASIAAQSLYWPLLLDEQKLGMDLEHHYKGEVNDIGTITHIRVNNIPDGGISRLRLFGKIVK